MTLSPAEIYIFSIASFFFPMYWGKEEKNRGSSSEDADDDMVGLEFEIKKTQRNIFKYKNDKNKK